MEKKELDLQKIEKEIGKIKPISFYRAPTMLFGFIMGLHIFYVVYHGLEHNLHHIALAGMWLVTSVAIFAIGGTKNYYKTIIEKLFQEIKRLEGAV